MSAEGSSVTCGSARGSADAPQVGVCVLVLGDIGRSPRMQYHAISLAGVPGVRVDFVGYKGAEPHKEIRNARNITLRYTATPWQLPARSPNPLFLVYAPFKVLLQVFFLLWILLRSVPEMDYLIVQNPPSIPTLLVAQLVCSVRGCQLVIDWHNFGYTILGLKLGQNHPVVRFARWFEGRFGRDAHAHLCVTKAMASTIRDQWHVRGSVSTLYDRSPVDFKRLTVEEVHKLHRRLRLETLLSGNNAEWSDICKLAEEDTILTSVPTACGSASLRHARPALVVSSTSWTEDEDFSLLLDAARKYDVRARGQPCAGTPTLPALLIVITGKGPLKEHYEGRIRQMPLVHVRILTVWLAIEDYPKLLGSADLGVSLHRSSSGLDLPMKVVDMLGCGLPVCAVKFDCLHELVQHGKNGMVFETSADLAECLIELLGGFPQESRKLSALRRGAEDFRTVSWQQHWDEVAKPIFFTSDPARRKQSPAAYLTSPVTALVVVVAVLTTVVYVVGRGSS